MRRHWYTLFLFSSLLLFSWKTDGPEGCAKQKPPAEVQEASVSMEETEKTPKYTSQAAAPPPASEAASLFPDNFRNVLFIGDSRTVGLSEYGPLGDADVFADSGMTVFNLWERKLLFDSSEQKTLEQILKENQYQAVHVMLGINELGYSMDQIVKSYKATVKNIQDMQPDARVVLAANLHVTSECSANSSVYNNHRLNELNGEIQNIGKELNCSYINVNEIFDDEQAALSKKFSTDGSHVLGKYYADWVQWIQDNYMCLP